MTCDTSSFITLTYDSKSLPDDSKDPLGRWDHSLHKHHWQNFAKKVRRDVGPFRYLHCGEYGDEDARPHLHALVFGQDFRAGAEQVDENLWSSPQLTSCWPWGFNSVGSVEFDSAAYVAAYTIKKRTKGTEGQLYQRFDPTTGECWEVEPEYATHSRRPGLGSTFIEKYMSDVYPADHVVVPGKGIFRPPAYYDDKLKEKDTDLWNYVMQKRRKNVRENLAEYSAERRQVKEAIAKARMKHHSALRQSRRSGRNFKR